MSKIVCVAVDWGTTSFRLWGMDRAGTVVDSRQGGRGMSTLKSAEFEAVLEENLHAIGAGPHVPVIVCGMAGAAQGWIEVPYVDTPCNLASLPGQAVRVPGIERDVRILPGLAQRDEDAPEVMRGEETLLFGTLHTNSVDGICCLPGTHSKWAWVEEGFVTRFSTAMTGELFGLLAHNSTLAPYIESVQSSPERDFTFDRAVERAISAPETVLMQLFSIRATPLLNGKTGVTDLSSRLSGLLIGLEIAGMHEAGRRQLSLIAGGHLSHLYARAFNITGIECTLINAETVAQRGLRESARIIWPGILSDEPS